MTTCEEKQSLNRHFDEDIASVDTTCLAQDDANQSLEESGSHDESDEVEEENADVNTWKTGSYWGSYAVPETPPVVPNDAIQPQEASAWVPISAVPVPVVPVSVVPVVEIGPTAAQIEAQLRQQAEEYKKQAAELEAEAQRLKNSGGNSSWTTIMLRNIPNNITRAELVDLLVRYGFGGKFDFIYLPVDFNRKANLGYAFVNLSSHQEANRFFDIFQGFMDWGLASLKISEVHWGHPLQGLQSHIDRYRNSPVMHNSVPDENKPILLRDGQRIPFPEPTKRIRAPRVSDRG
jgi:hypothetical protein